MFDYILLFSYALSLRNLFCFYTGILNVKLLIVLTFLRTFCNIQNLFAIMHRQVLKNVDALRKKVVSAGKEHASLCAKVRLLAGY